ncbi:MAG: tRNA (adenosine(37)-N6)-threonylcarbamoyltransferase complex ATPase subunit type 1 TsaE [Spirochaetes bacterium]|nr:tRNA (adenosine(37)-N6)-threonylcarbamoyltransferase complex ATPase subunit type 1 TsaE [Spirochaetota bacterium]
MTGKRHSEPDFFFVTNSPEETFALGERIAGRLSHGSIVALEGPLGSGKTHFTKGIAFGLGISENITSPTYTIISEYKSSGSYLYHIDAYRLNNDRDFEDIGGTEIINSNGISVIEWGGRILKSLPDNTITISIEITGQSSRLIKITGVKKI